MFSHVFQSFLAVGHYAPVLCVVCDLLFFLILMIFGHVFPVFCYMALGHNAQMCNLHSFFFSQGFFVIFLRMTVVHNAPVLHVLCDLLFVFYFIPIFLFSYMRMCEVCVCV